MVVAAAADIAAAAVRVVDNMVAENVDRTFLLYFP